MPALQLAVFDRTAVCAHGSREICAVTVMGLEGVGARVEHHKKTILQSSRPSGLRMPLRLCNECKIKLLSSDARIQCE